MTAEDFAPAVEPERVARVTEENARLRMELRHANARAQRFEADARRVRASTKYTVGDLLVRGAKDPRRLFLLPRELLSLYRLRKHRRTAIEVAPTEVTRAHRSDLSNEQAARLLLPRIGAAADASVSVGGALSRATEQLLQPYAATTSVLPHDAAALIRDADPDIVFVDTAAGLPGESWSHLGNPAATDRALAAFDLVTAARERGRPVVMLRNSSPGHTAGLVGIIDRCDLVVDATQSVRENVWLPGTRLDWWNGQQPADLDNPQPHRPLLTVSDDATSRHVRAWALSRGVEPVNVRPQAPPIGALREAIALADFFVDTQPGTAKRVGGSAAMWAALVSGLPIVSSDTHELSSVLGELVEPQHGIVYPFVSASDLDEALNAAQAGPAMSLATHWQVLRRIALRHTAPVTLTDLAQRLHLSISPGACRGIAVVVGAEVTADQLVEQLLAQTLRPAEIVVRGSISERLRDQVLQLHIDVVDASGDIARITQSTTSPWIGQVHCPPTMTLPADLLLDAMISAEITQASQVQLGHVAPGGPQKDIGVHLLRRSVALGSASAPLTIAPPHPGWHT